MPLIRWLGDWAYAILISLGWQPREERGKPRPPEPPASE